MPIYAYRCSECGHALDVLQKVSDPQRTDCPACGQPALVKQVTAAGFQLKGSGWYVTDFRDGKKSAKPDAGAETPAEAKPAESTESKAADAKPAETKPAETKPADGKTADAQPAATAAAPPPASAS